MFNLKQILMWLVGLGLILALLKMHNNDPFGVIGWAWDSAKNFVFSVRDLFVGNDTFRHITSKPVPQVHQTH